MSVIESEATFVARALTFGIPVAYVDQLKASRLASFGAFAFLVPYGGTSTDDGPLKAALEGIFGGAIDVPNMSKFRRLQFESHALLLSDARSKIERTETSEPRKVPAPERAERLRLQAAKLTGVNISGSIEPSFALLDLVQQVVEENTMTYIPLERATSRLQELHGIKREPAVKIDATGAFKYAEKATPLSVDLSSDYKLRQAFLRRALAFDQSNLIGFHCLERWTEHLFAAMFREPPPDYAAVSRIQILEADRELFTYVAEKCRAGLQIDGNGVLPAEAAVDALFHDPRIAFFMLPLPAVNRSSPKRAFEGTGDAARSTAQPKPARARRRKGDRDKAEPVKKAAPQGAKSGWKPDVVVLPKALEGMWKHHKGQPFCFQFNLGNCPLAPAGGTCAKGVHKCMHPKCGLDHSVKDHPK
jgi:hypothetical protein